MKRAKQLLFALATASAVLAPAIGQARDTVLHLPMDAVFELPQAKAQLDGSVRFFLAGAKAPTVQKRLGTGVTNRKTNGVGHGDEEACKWAALSALIALQKSAKAQGGNAVVDIVSYYKKAEYRDAGNYECHARWREWSASRSKVTTPPSRPEIRFRLEPVGAPDANRAGRHRVARRVRAAEARADRLATPPRGIRCRTARAAHAAAGFVFARSGVRAAQRQWSSRGRRGSPHLHLSLAHRHDWVAAALAGSPIGIDLELIRARNVDALAPLCCPQPEQEQLRALPAAQRLIRFHQLWVIKEAAFKAALTPHGALSFAQRRRARGHDGGLQRPLLGMGRRTTARDRLARQRCACGAAGPRCAALLGLARGHPGRDGVGGCHAVAAARRGGAAAVACIATAGACGTPCRWW